jgi:hypothetical protein
MHPKVSLQLMVFSPSSPSHNLGSHKIDNVGEEFGATTQAGLTLNTGDIGFADFDSSRTYISLRFTSYAGTADDVILDSGEVQFDKPLLKHEIGKRVSSRNNMR